MEAFQDRRKLPRIVVAQGLALRGRASHFVEVRFLDLSQGGARIAHLGLLRPGARSVLELPPIWGPLVLPVEIARSQVVGTQPNLFGERHLCYESGLVFADPSAEHRAILAGILRRLSMAGSPEGEQLRLSDVTLEGSPPRGEILEVAGAIARSPGWRATDYREGAS